jgi:homocysteine S-methyltransferase
MDGGLATQLEAQGCDIGNSLWSASLLQSDPESIVAAHCAYIDAGAQCIETASYQASREGFAAIGLKGPLADKLMLRSVALAQRARDKCKSDIAIAASLGPYGAMLHDGSEYRGDYGVEDAVLREFHQKRIALFDRANADVLALETIPSLPEAGVLAQLLRDCETPAWISFSCRDAQHICDGTPLADAAALFQDHPVVVAVGINCTPPQFVPELVRVLRAAVPGKPVLAYPNSGEIYHAGDNSWTGTVTPGDCASAAGDWLHAGAKAIGGCCRMGPSHVAAMGAMLRRMT